MDMEAQNTQTPDRIKELVLPGEKLVQDSSDVSQITSYGWQLYTTNKDFIKQNIPENWFAVIEPTTGVFVASDDMRGLYDYTQRRFPGKLFYYVGLLKNNRLAVHAG